MRILFLCGSLEPGCDGVGDYTRLLAAEFIRSAYQTEIIAINDRYVRDLSEGVQSVGEVCVPVFRVPSNMKEHARLGYAREKCLTLDPHWISLQFVPYSFQNKGVPFGLGPLLESLGKGRKWHIMFHELWIGGRGFKSKLTSLLQQSIIKTIIKTLKPSILHTHLPVYLTELLKIDANLNVRPLPLISNIPVLDDSNCICASKEQSAFKIGFFSQIGLNNNVLFFLNALVNNIRYDLNKDVEIILIGGAEIKMQAAIETIETNISMLKGRVKYTGFIRADDVSSYIKQCNLGITPVHKHGLGKSGSVAAFIAHGVPVAVPNTHEDYAENDIGFFSQKLRDSVILTPGIQNLDRVTIAAQQAAKEISLYNITQKMLQDLITGS